MKKIKWLTAFIVMAMLTGCGTETSDIPITSESVSDNSSLEETTSVSVTDLTVSDVAETTTESTVSESSETEEISTTIATDVMTSDTAETVTESIVSDISETEEIAAVSDISETTTDTAEIPAVNTVPEISEPETTVNDEQTDTFYTDKKKAEENVMSYVGAGYRIVSSESLPNNDNANYFKVGISFLDDSYFVTYFYAGRDFCFTEDEWLGTGDTQTSDFFADKRSAEDNVRSYVGTDCDIISSESLPNNDNANYFKVGVKSGSSDVTYYYAGKDFCFTEEEWLQE